MTVGELRKVIENVDDKKVFFYMTVIEFSATFI